MEREITRDDLMRYLDGEASPDERAWIGESLSASTELQRELALFRAMKSDLQDLTFVAPGGSGSVWDVVNRRLTRPMGWAFFLSGSIVWFVYGAYLFGTSAANPLEKMATGAIVIGLLLLLLTVIWERYKEWLSDPYRDVHR